MSNVKADTEALIGIIDTSKRLHSEVSSFSQTSNSNLNDSMGNINTFMAKVEESIRRGDEARDVLAREEEEAEEARKRGESYEYSSAQIEVERADALKRIYPDLKAAQKEFQFKASQFKSVLHSSNLGENGDMESFVRPLITVLDDYAKQNFNSASYSSFSSHCGGGSDGDGDGEMSLEMTFHRSLGD